MAKKRSLISAQSRERFRRRMAHTDSLGQLALLGVAAGLLSGLVIIAFRLVVESVQAGFLAGGDPENYESLAWWWRLLLPLAGGLVIGLVFQSVAEKWRFVGVVHVMERLAYHQANLPARSAVLQFFGAAVSIISGHSVGREGPAVHLGAASGSYLGQRLFLPNQSTRTLAACGIAAAIAASFNTPLAGVIFSMEVVLMEYTLAGFIPVILAAVTATALSHFFFGPAPAFSVPEIQAGSLQELPVVLVAGLGIGCLSSLFIYLLIFFSGRARTRPFWQRTTLGGLAVGICALVMPPVMGIGYDTVNAAIVGELGLVLLLSLLAFKILATTAGLGLGLPGGLIGPTLVIGAAAGAAVHLVAAQLGATSLASPALYTLVGMGAMMGATLQAPLAALAALLELTANPHIILPGMLAIVSASLISSQVFGKGPVFLLLMRARGLDYDTHPLTQSLRRIGVSKAMDKVVIECPERLTARQADELLQQQPHWLLVRPERRASFAMPAADLAKAMKIDSAEVYQLTEIPAGRHQTEVIDQRATLQEALELMSRSGVDLLYVSDTLVENETVLGVLTREDIEEHYLYPQGPKR